MVASNFAPALKAVLVHEGGFSNHPADPGGVTLQGVIQRVYDSYRKGKGLPIRALTKSMLGTAEWERERNEIYYKRYWEVIQGDRLPAGLDYVVYDGCVNSGASQVTKWLQRALADVGIRGVGVDGVLGKETLDAIGRVDDIDRLITKIQDRRLAMLKSLRTWPVFGKGWARRVSEVRTLGHAVAYGSVDLPMPQGWAGGKAYVEDAKALPPRVIGDSLASGGVVQTTLAAATEALAPVADRSATFSTVLVVLMVVGALATVAGLLYTQWAKRRAVALADALDLPELATGVAT